MEEGKGFLAVAIAFGHRFAQHGNIAAGAEAAPFGMIEDDRLERVVCRPFHQRGGHFLAHRLRQRMQRLGPVERDMSDRTVAADQYFPAHLSRSRPTIMRITWLVPSRIEWTRRSRQKRSIGYSCR